MRDWLRLVLVTMTVGGGFHGFVMTTSLLFSPQNRNPAYLALIIGFLSLYAFVLAAGLLLVQDPRRTRPLVFALLLQVPWICSPLVVYRFTAGFHFTTGLIGGKFAAAFRLGSDWQFSLLQPFKWGIGVNLFALIFLILVVRSAWKSDTIPQIANVATGYEPNTTTSGPS